MAAAPPTWQVLRRNPDLLKALWASGLQRSAVMVGSTLATSNLRAMVWGTHMSEYTAILSIALSATAILTGGPVGRLGDRVGRRAAALLYGGASFLPAWALLLVGFNATGLYVNSAATVLSGVGLCSDALLVLVSEVTREEDREVAYGMFQAATNLISFVLFGLPAIFMTTWELPGFGIHFWLSYQAVLSFLFFLTIFAMGATPSASRAGPAPGEGGVELGAAPCKPDGQPAAPAPTGRGGGLSQITALLQRTPVLSGLVMVCKDPKMISLYLTATLLAFSGDLVFDIGSQFFRDELGLLPNGTLHENQLVSVLSTVPPGLIMIPASVFVGFLARRMGSLVLLRAMIPMAALMTAAGALLAVMPRYFMIPLVCIAQNFASLAGNVPLKHLVAQAAPEGQVGEAMGTLGMVMQAVSLVANAATAAITPTLYRHMDKPLWLYYIACGALTFLGVIPLATVVVADPAGRHPPGDKGKEEAASAAPVEAAANKAGFTVADEVEDLGLVF